MGALISTLFPSTEPQSEYDILRANQSNSAIGDRIQRDLFSERDITDEEMEWALGIMNDVKRRKEVTAAYLKAGPDEDMQQELESIASMDIPPVGGQYMVNIGGPEMLRGSLVAWFALTETKSIVATILSCNAPSVSVEIAMLMVLRHHGIHQLEFKGCNEEIVTKLRVWSKEPEKLTNTVFERFMKEIQGSNINAKVKAITVKYNAETETHTTIIDYQTSDDFPGTMDNSAPGVYIEGGAEYIPLSPDKPVNEAGIGAGSTYQNRFSIDEIKRGVVEVGLNIKEWLIMRKEGVPRELSPAPRLFGAQSISNGGNGMVYEHDAGKAAVKIMGHFTVRQTNASKKYLLHFSILEIDRPYSEDTIQEEIKRTGSARVPYARSWEADAKTLDELYLWDKLTEKNPTGDPQIIPILKLYVFRNDRAPAQSFYAKNMVYPELHVASVIGVDMPMMTCNLGDILANIQKPAHNRKLVADLLKKVQMKLSILVAKRVQWLHGQDVVHQDIKPDNFLVKFTPKTPGRYPTPLNAKAISNLSLQYLLELCNEDSMQMVIADFGASVVYIGDNPPQKRLKREIYTPWYRPPERYLYIPIQYNTYAESIANARRLTGSRYKSDVYATGNVFKDIWEQGIRPTGLYITAPHARGESMEYHMGLLPDSYLNSLFEELSDDPEAYNHALTHTEEYMRVQIKSLNNGVIYSMKEKTEQIRSKDKSSLIHIMMALNPVDRYTIDDVVSNLDGGIMPTSPIRGTPPVPTFTIYETYIENYKNQEKSPEDVGKGLSPKEFENIISPHKKLKMSNEATEGRYCTKNKK